MNRELSLISIQVNLLAFCYVVLKRVFGGCRRKHHQYGKSASCVLKPFPCEEITIYRKNRREEHVKARA